MKRFYNIIYPVIWKEFIHIRRDARTLAVLFLIPTGLMLLVGFVVNFDVSHIRLAVLDEDKTNQSRDFVQSFIHTEYFDYTYAAQNQNEIDTLLDDGKIDGAIIIPQKFSDALVKGQTSDVQVLVDGSNSTTAPTMVGYIGGAITSYSAKLRTDAFLKMGIHEYAPVDFRPRAWYNPELSTVKYLIPGLIGYVLMLTSVVATAMSIVKEKERATMEQIVVSSVSSFELIIGKLLPYLIIAMSSTAVLLLASFVVFGVAIIGSLVWLFFSILIFLVCALALGLWVSTISDSQQVAFQISGLVSTLPSVMLSGFIYPIRSMPVPVQIATNFTPVKFFIHAIRAIMLKGVGPFAFWQDWMAMVIFAAIVIGISTRRLQRQKL